MRFLLILLVLVPSLSAEEAGRPRHNNSYVPDDDQDVAGLLLDVRHAAESGDAGGVADRLQAILVADGPGVVALKGRKLFCAPRRWAQIQLLSERAPFGPEVLAAWRKVHDAEANSELKSAIATGDEEAILELIDRYPGATAAPTALLALSDRALQRGDPDAALGYLLRVPEHVARSEEKAILAAEPYRARLAHLRALPPRRPAGWPTLGGDATRARNGDAVPAPDLLTRRWTYGFTSELPSFTNMPRAKDRDLSPVLPFYPVCDDERVYLHLGGAVVALDRATGAWRFVAPRGAEVPNVDVLDEMLEQSPGVRAATIVDGVLYFNRLSFNGFREPESANALIAFDVEKQATLWEVRPRGGRGILSEPIFFRGAPAVVGERVYVYGAVRALGDDGPTRKELAYLFCFGKTTGRLLWHRFLGYGDTEAAPAFPPLSGLAPAVSAGVVVVVTGLGVAAGLDAQSGEILWLLRYDRQPVRERERLSKWEEEKKVHLGSSWKREPPRIRGDTVYFAPFDSEEMYACWLRGARDPRSGIFDLEKWAKGRTRGHWNSLLEYVAGLDDTGIYYVGRRDPHHFPEMYQTVVAHPLTSEKARKRYGLLPPVKREVDAAVRVPPELFGRPTIAGRVLLVPTRDATYRFDIGRDPAKASLAGEPIREIPLLEPFTLANAEEKAPVWGTLVALDGFLYAVTSDRVICYGKATGR